MAVWCHTHQGVLACKNAVDACAASEVNNRVALTDGGKGNGVAASLAQVGSAYILKVLLGVSGRRVKHSMIIADQGHDSGYLLHGAYYLLHGVQGKGRYTATGDPHHLLSFSFSGAL